LYPTVRVEAGHDALISSSGASLLISAAQVSGLAAGLSAGLARWRSARAVHDPGKVVLDLAISLAAGGDCLADIAVARAQPELFGAVASDPTVSRLVEVLAADPDAAIEVLAGVRAAAREKVWAGQSPIAETGPVVVDIDATLVGSHSDKESAAPNFKRGFGFHPLLTFVDHGPGGTGEPLAGLLRAGNAGSNTAADQIAVIDAAIAQLPEKARSRVLVRADSAGGTKNVLGHLTEANVAYSVGLTAHDPVDAALASLPRQAWRAAINADGGAREGAQVAELTRWMPASFRRKWPARMRVIVRRERPHVGAQLRLTDIDGWRTTVFATNVTGGRLPELERNHRLRARAEDRIRNLKDTGLTNLPFHEFAKNRIWLELVQLAGELLTWTQLLAWTHHPARTWEPKTVRLRILAVAARLVTTSRRRILRISKKWPWADLILAGHHRLTASFP